MDHDGQGRDTPTRGTTPFPASQSSGDQRFRGEQPGDWIGEYKVLEIIGEGGFGVVWLAERREPMVQRVALKIIKPGMDSKAVIARFDQERQALAVMDHPNVARILDGGVTPSGRPFFVMEYVKGEPLTTFADRNRLTIRQRLELFIPVCDAVQHAHLKGIIHRDLKPSNILVSPIGGENDPNPASTRGMLVKVIDFGVAKAISHTLTDKTIFTERGQIIGTPEYMSPEQADMGATDIDTRTDVYSLGVVLYELLSGTLPFDSRSLRSAGYAEIQRIICEVDPPRPSTQLSTMDDATGAAIAKARQADREKIAGELRRELEWIPLMAMRKDRRRRYVSAESLAIDVKRYLNAQPLHAAPDSRAYLFRKFLRRNRLPVVAAACVVFAVAVGAAATVWQASLVRQEARRLAEERRLGALYNDADYFMGTGRSLDAVDMFRQVVQGRTSIHGEGHKLTLLGMGGLHTALWNVGRTDEAIAVLADRLSRLKKYHPPSDPWTANCMVDYAGRLAAVGRHGEAAEAFREAMTTADSNIRLYPKGVGNHRDKANAMVGLSRELRALGREEDAKAVLLEGAKTLPDGLPRNLGDDTFNAVHSVLSEMKSAGVGADASNFARAVAAGGLEQSSDWRVWTNLGEIESARLRWDDAAAAWNGARRAAANLPDAPRILARIDSLQGKSLLSGSRPLEAEPLLRSALQQQRSMDSIDPTHILETIDGLANACEANKKFADAEMLWRAKRAGAAAQWGPHHGVTLWAAREVVYQLVLQGKPEEAEREATMLMSQCIHDTSRDRRAALFLLTDLVVAQAMQQKDAEAVASYRYWMGSELARESESEIRRARGWLAHLLVGKGLLLEFAEELCVLEILAEPSQDSSLRTEPVKALLRIGDIAQKRGDRQTEYALRKEVMAWASRDNLFSEMDWVFWFVSRTAHLAGEFGECERGVEYSDLAILLCERQLGSDHPLVAELCVRSAGLLTSCGRAGDSLDRLDRGYRLLLRTQGSTAADTQRAAIELAGALRKAGRLAESAELLKSVLPQWRWESANRKLLAALRFSRLSSAEAEALLPEALELARESPLAEHISTLGVAYYRAGKFEKAIEALRRSEAARAESKQPSLPANWAFIAMSLHRLDRIDEARAARAEFEKSVSAMAADNAEEIARWRSELAELFAGATTPLPK